MTRPILSGPINQVSALNQKVVTENFKQKRRASWVRHKTALELIENMYVLLILTVSEWTRKRKKNVSILFQTTGTYY